MEFNIFIIMIYIYILEKNHIPFYVGKTKYPVRRKHKHHQTYGNDIKLTIIDEVIDWKYWESYWIEQFKAWGFNLINQNKGGGGPEKYTEIQKQKMRKSRKEGTGKKISDTLKNNNHSKYYTEDVRQRISQNNQNKPRPFSDIHKQNMGIAKRRHAIPVLQYDIDGILIKEWESKGQAAEWIKEQTGKTSNITSQIKDCILGRQKTAYGYIWKYKKDLLK
jgi:predicted GIY-YIG superfamily endonuclease